MSTMPSVQRSFATALNGKAQCLKATLTYEKNEADRKDQRLNFSVVKPNGDEVLVTEIIPPLTDLVAKAHEMGRTYAATLGSE